MTHEEARGLHDAYLREARDRTPRLVPGEWGTPARTEERADSWVFVYREAQPSDPDTYEAVVIRKDRSGPYILLGAIGGASRVAETDLGLPRSNERWLGSGPGRYQAFDGGLLVWHEDPGLAYARRIPPEITTGRRCLGLVAFLDLRGFGHWSRRRNPRDVQALMSTLEDILQDALNRAWCRLVFVKGLGDGIMIVSESEWFTAPGESGPSVGPPDHQRRPRPGHLSALLGACGQFVLEGQAAIPRELAIGCGIDVGELNQVFLFGQSDYLGEPVNSAAELQQLAWNEIIVSTRFADGLVEDGETRDGRAGGVPLADRGIRIDPKACA
jgi:class 3 adenylate cyclase